MATMIQVKSISAEGDIVDTIINVEKIVYVYKRPDGRSFINHGEEYGIRTAESFEEIEELLHASGVNIIYFEEKE